MGFAINPIIKMSDFDENSQRIFILTPVRGKGKGKKKIFKLK